MPQAIGYVRVSTPGQAASGLSEDEQVRAVTAEWERELKPHGFTLDIVRDLGVSAGKVEFAKRPGGAEVCRRLGHGDAVVFSKLDRAFRDVRDQINQQHAWTQAGVRVLAADLRGMRFDSTNPWGKLIVFVMGFTAEMEYERICERNRERVRAGNRTGRNRGSTPPRGFKYIYNSNDNGKTTVIHPDDQKRAWMRFARAALDVHGWSLAQIMAKMHAKNYLNDAKKAGRVLWTKPSLSKLIEAERRLAEAEARYKDLDKVTPDAPFGWFVVPTSDGWKTFPRRYPVAKKLSKKEITEVTEDGVDAGGGSGYTDQADA